MSAAARAKQEAMRLSVRTAVAQIKADAHAEAKRLNELAAKREARAKSEELRTKQKKNYLAINKKGSTEMVAEVRARQAKRSVEEWAAKSTQARAQVSAKQVERRITIEASINAKKVRQERRAARLVKQREHHELRLEWGKIMVLMHSGIVMGKIITHAHDVRHHTDHLAQMDAARLQITLEATEKEREEQVAAYDTPGWHRKRRKLKRMSTRLMKDMIHPMERRLRSAAELIERFLLGFSKSARFGILMKTFRWKVVRCQRVVRRSQAMFRTRLLMLRAMWDKTYRARGRRLFELAWRAQMEKLSDPSETEALRRLRNRARAPPRATRNALLRAWLIEATLAHVKKSHEMNTKLASKRTTAHVVFTARDVKLLLQGSRRPGDGDGNVGGSASAAGRSVQKSRKSTAQSLAQMMANKERLTANPFLIFSAAKKNKAMQALLSRAFTVRLERFLAEFREEATELAEKRLVENIMAERAARQHEKEQREARAKKKALRMARMESKRGGRIVVVTPMAAEATITLPAAADAEVKAPIGEGGVTLPPIRGGLRGTEHMVSDALLSKR